MRMIDADALKASIDDNWYIDMMVSEIWSVIDHAPTIGGWISVQDRLPEKDGEYLVFIRSPYAGYSKIAGFSTDKTATHTFLDAGYGWSNYDSDYGYYECKDVTHWMPLPEPPEEVSGDG